MSEITIETQSGTCQAYLAMPHGSGKYPGLILVEEIWGVNDHIKDVAHRFAKEGFIVLAPELLPEGVLVQMTPEMNIARFDPQKRNEVQTTLRAAMQPTQT